MSVNGKTILLVEDEVGLADALKFNLESDGFTVVLAHDGLVATGLLSTTKYDLVILDVMLPEIDGYQICKQYRETNTHTPVIFLTARGTGNERVHGLKIGANDYLTKPFEYDELLLRSTNLIQAAAVQHKPEKPATFTFGNCMIDFEKLLATGALNQPVTLSKIEFEMMTFFVLNANRVISRDEIYKNIWGYHNNAIPNTRTLDNFIVSLRKYFELNPSQPQHIISVRGFGYKFVC